MLKVEKYQLSTSVNGPQFSPKSEPQFPKMLKQYWLLPNPKYSKRKQITNGKAMNESTLTQPTKKINTE